MRRLSSSCCLLVKPTPSGSSACSLTPHPQHLPCAPGAAQGRRPPRGCARARPQPPAAAAPTLVLRRSSSAAAAAPSPGGCSWPGRPGPLARCCCCCVLRGRGPCCGREAAPPLLARAGSPIRRGRAPHRWRCAIELGAGGVAAAGPGRSIERRFRATRSVRPPAAAPLHRGRRAGAAAALGAARGRRAGCCDSCRRGCQGAVLRVGGGRAESCQSRVVLAPCLARFDASACIWRGEGAGPSTRPRPRAALGRRAPRGAAQGDAPRAWCPTAPARRPRSPIGALLL
jgi:hypothetical protein